MLSVCTGEKVVKVVAMYAVILDCGLTMQLKSSLTLSLWVISSEWHICKNCLLLNVSLYPCHFIYYAPSKMNQLKFWPLTPTVWKQYIKQFFTLREKWNFCWLSEIFIFSSIWKIRLLRNCMQWKCKELSLKIIRIDTKGWNIMKTTHCKFVSASQFSVVLYGLRTG